MVHGYDIVVIGMSAGGVEALSELVAGLPPGLPSSLFVVCHVPAQSRSRLPQILGGRGPLPAGHAADGEPIRPGRIYVAPPDFHLLVRSGRVEVHHGPRENRHRPAIDPLFRTAAAAYGRRVVGVVLSGGSSDGSAGLLAVRAAGGLAVVQDPAEAPFPQMPQAARDIAGADFTLPVSEISALLARLAGEPVRQPQGARVDDPLERMAATVKKDMADQQSNGRRGGVAVFTCPECGGAMWQVDQREVTRFRCHVGHAYYGDDLLAEQTQALEAALWTAVRTFREKAILARQLAAREQANGNAPTAQRFEEDAQVAERYGDLIQGYLLNGAAGVPGGGIETAPVPNPSPDHRPGLGRKENPAGAPPRA
jgi:two-component system chemotaxis response regulator CheB